MAEKKAKINKSPDTTTYNYKVKERLANWLNDLRESGFDINFSKLCKCMSETFQLETSEQKLRQMFDTQYEREIKLAEIVALSHLLQIPLATLCEFSVTPAIELNRPWIYPKKKTEEGSGIFKLINSYYEGDYYAYYFKPKHFDRLDLGGKNPVAGSAIQEAKVEIVVEQGEPYVVLREKTIDRDFYNQKDLDRFVLKGKLYLIERSKIAYAFINDSEGRRSMALMFEFKDFSKDILYYRTAAMLTISLNEIHKPLFQKIALFRVPQNLEDKRNEDILRGILSLNSGPIMIEKDYYDSVRDDAAYKDYKLNELLPAEEKTYYIFSEPSIRDSVHNWTSDESVQILLKLREMSAFQAHEIVSEPEYFQTFIKKFQQMQMAQQKGQWMEDCK